MLPLQEAQVPSLVGGTKILQAVQCSQNQKITHKTFTLE